jgi:ribonuclease HI
VRNPDATGRIAKWALELMGQGISYAPRTAIKSQVLADFIAEWTETQLPSGAIDEEYWTMHFDGSMMKRGAVLGLVFISPLGVCTRYVIRIHFPTSNNVAEYEALLNGLRIAIELGIRRLEVRGNSQLIVNQVMKESSCLSPKMAAYYQEVRQLEDKFDGLKLNHIPQQLNEAADTLAKMASSSQPIPRGIFASDQYKPSVRYEEPEQSEREPPASGSRADQPPTPPDPEVMELDKELALEPDTPAD